MIEMVHSYLDLIVRERSWSWAVVCLLYIFAALFVRGWFVGSLWSHTKMLDKKNSHKLRSEYLKGSLLGWLFFFLPVVLIIMYWRKELLPFVIQEKIMIIIGFTSLAVSIFLHLQAFAMASILTLESLESSKNKHPEI